MKLYINISCLVVVLLILFVLTFSIKSCLITKPSDTEDIAKQEIESAEFAAQAGTLTDGISDPVETDDRDSLDTVRISSDETEQASSVNSDLTGTDASAAKNTDYTASELPAAPITLTVSVVGDCTIGTDENFDYSQSPNAFFEYYGADYFFQNVKSIFAADDLTIANFEGTLTNSYNRQDKQFAFKAPPECASILTAGAIEAVNTANNHSHDYGEESFTDTMQALDAEGIVHFGYDETAVMDVKGVKIGLVGIYELNDHMGIAQQMKDNIARVKSQGANLVIVILHWGNEKEEMPDENQTTLGRMAIDEGADLVCGHHSHVLQGIENYKGKNIVYSLGNFCFGGNQYPSDMDSMIFQQTFTIGPEGVVSDNVTNIIPVSISSEAYFNNYQPTPAEGSEATRILNKIAERTSYIPLP
ncbi:MAG: CapA family protein [Blautia sp.]|nr:CapA family protein [Blautia sp.]